MQLRSWYWRLLEIVGVGLSQIFRMWHPASIVNISVCIRSYMADQYILIYLYPACLLSDERSHGHSQHKTTLETYVESLPQAHCTNRGYLIPCDLWVYIWAQTPVRLFHHLSTNISALETWACLWSLSWGSGLQPGKFHAPTTLL